MQKAHPSHIYLFVGGGHRRRPGGRRGHVPVLQRARRPARTVHQGLFGGAAAGGPAQTAGRVRHLPIFLEVFADGRCGSVKCTDL